MLRNARLMRGGAERSVGYTPLMADTGVEARVGTALSKTQSRSARRHALADALVNCPVTIFMIVLVMCLVAIGAVVAFVIWPGEFMVLDGVAYDLADERSIAVDSLAVAQLDIENKWDAAFDSVQGYFAASTLSTDTLEQDPLLGMFIGNPGQLLALGGALQNFETPTVRRLLQFTSLEWQGFRVIIMFHLAKSQGGMYSANGRKAILDFINVFVKIKDYEKYCLKREAGSKVCAQLRDVFVDVLDGGDIAGIEYVKGVIPFSQDVKVEDLKKWFLDEVDDKLSKYARETRGDDREVEMTYLSLGVRRDQILRIMLWDALRVLISVGFLVAYMAVSLESIFLALGGVVQVLLSPGIAWAVQYFFGQVKYFSILNVFVLFVAVSVGIDDIFVAHQSYRQSKAVSDNLRLRVRWMLPRVAWTMFVTSFTSAAAFFLTCLAPLASTCSFGIFAGTAVLVDYVLVLFLFVPTMIMYYEVLGTEPWPAWLSWTRLLELFYLDMLPNLLRDTGVRVVCGVTWTMWVGACVYFSLGLSSEAAVDAFFHDGHPIERAGRIFLDHFNNEPDSARVQASAVWGLGDVDRAGVNLIIDPEFSGEPRYASSNSFDTVACRQALLDVEEYLKTSLEASVAAAVDQDYSERVFITAYRAPTQDPEDNIQSTAEVITALTQARALFIVLEFPVKGLTIGKFESRKTTEEIYQRVEQVVSYVDVEWVSKHCGVKADTFQISDSDKKFTLSRTREVYDDLMWQGIVAGLAISFAVLLATSWSLPITIFATFTVCAALASVLGAMQWMGWDVGLAESVLITVTTGFSVDYVVHMATDYSRQLWRAEKGVGWVDHLGLVLVDVGPSVFHSMTTSVIGALPLLTCVLLPLYKFGVFLLLVVVSSFFASHMVFLPLMVTWELFIYGVRD